MSSAHERGYPRPQLCRAGWYPLNGEWDFALDPSAQWDAPDNVKWSSRIRVPFADYLCERVPPTMTDDDALFLGDILSTAYCCAENGGIHRAAGQLPGIDGPLHQLHGVD